MAPTKRKVGNQTTTEAETSNLHTVVVQIAASPEQTPSQTIGADKQVQAHRACRCPDPAVRRQLVIVLRDLSSWIVDAEDNTGMHGLSWFRPRGRTSSKGVCEGTVLSCTGGACSRGYRRGERGREAPKSLLEVKLIEASANIGC